MLHQDLFSALEMRTQCEGRPLQVGCYRSGDETEGSNMEKRRETEDLKLTYLLHCPTCFSGRLGWRVPREHLLELGFRNIRISGEEG